MSDYEKMKAAAEFIMFGKMPNEFEAVTAFRAEATPSAVIELIAENERIKARLCVCRDCGGQGEIYSGHSSYQGYNQPPEPDMDVCGTCGGDGVLGPLEDFESLAAERDQLKAECEGLRADAKRANYWKQRAKSAEGHLFAGDWRAAALELHRYSRFESTPWPELTGQQRALICSAAGSVIACVNAMRTARKPKDGADNGEIIWCECGDGYAANSYGAGFMAANDGVCENCDAANGGVEPVLDTPASKESAQ